LRTTTQSRARSTSAGIASRLVAWQQRHGRHDLPWQGTRDAYRIWLSEIMLQQTRVSTVIPYFERFIARFPTLATLAEAGEEEVLALWSGLGYYSRARNLLRCARQVMAAHGGTFPCEPSVLQRLPGIGRSTAAAIAVFAWGRRAAILDGNARRVLARWAGVDEPVSRPDVQQALWELAERELPQASVEAYTQGLMDLGASVCTRSRPSCASCPLADDCVALGTGRTGVIPVGRVRGPLPVRESVWLVVRRSGTILLEKRPVPGLWGGLWSLPEATVASRAALVDEIRQRFALDVEECGALEPVAHAFTHFRLHARPMLFESCREGGADVSSGAASSGLCWLAPDQAETAALPAPVKTLLKTLT